MSLHQTKYSTESIRNLVVSGQAGGGKTTLVEAMLFASGAIGRPGRVEDGNTVCDYDELSQEMKHSIDSTLVHFDHNGGHVNLIDTPGAADFIGKSFLCFPAVETVMVVVDASTGIDTVTRRVMRFAEERDLPRLIVVNKIDHGADLATLVAAIQETFGDICRPVNLPVNGGTGVVDCFRNAEGESDIGPVAEYRTALIDQVVEVDEELMAQYLESGKVSHAALHDPFEKALRERHLVPICFTAAREGVGVKELMDMIVHLCPNPMEGNPRPFEYDEDGKIVEWHATPDASLPEVAHVFKVTSDPYVGKLAFFRVHQGHIAGGMQPRLDDGRKPIRIGHVYKIQGKQHVEVDKVIAGDIGAVSKIEEIHWNSVLHSGDVHEHMHLKPLPLPRPMYGLAIEGTNKSAETKLGEALQKLSAEDPTFQYERVAATQQLVIRGLGELHLRVKLRLLKDRYGIEVKSEVPKVAYKETITVKAEGHHRHKKQTGGAGQFGEVYLRVEPLPEGEASGEMFEFVDDTFGGSIPRQFLPAIEKGIRGVLHAGCVAGYPMQGIRVSVYDGKHHPVDSKEVAFMTAGKKAFIDAVMKARPALLEPFVKLEITAPADYLGDISGDLSGRRGRIQGTDMLPGNVAVVRAEVPLSELMSYANQLKSMTQGAGSYAMEYSHDEPAPANIQQAVMAAFKPHADED